MICLLYYLRRNPNAKLRTQIYFLFSAFLIFIMDYGITKVFMEGLPLNVERLWVLRDFIAVPFVAMAIYAVVSSQLPFPRAKSPKTTNLFGLQATSKPNTRRILTLTLAVNIMIAALVAGWITLSLTAAYPHVAPLQTTSYELEAVKYIESNTHEKYVVIGDVWATYAGEVIVGVSNPRAYYYAPFDTIGYYLFVNMKQDPSPHWLLLAMNYTATTVAYFIVSEPRLGTEAFNDVVTRTFENGQLSLAGIFGDEKLYVFSYRKE
jgi:hypothetical protein